MVALLELVFVIVCVMLGPSGPGILRARATEGALR